MLKFTYIFFGSFFLIELMTQAQNINFTSLSSKDGLLSNSVNAIIKDRYGLMWFATDDGLNKFDGTNFTIYRYRPGDTTSLRSNEVLCLHEDNKGNLWVGTSGGGLCMYNRKKDAFTFLPAKSGSVSLNRNDLIRSICSGHQGKIWIAQYESLYALDPVSLTLSKHPIADANGKPIKATLICVYEDSKHRLWIGSDSGLFLYRSETNTFVQYKHNSSDPFSLASDLVKAIAEDKWGNLWIGTSGGLSKLQTNESGFITYRHTKESENSLSNNEINCIASDTQGLLWVGTNDGLNVLNPSTNIFTTYTSEYGNINSLSRNWIKCSYIDKHGIYWFGTFRGGINKYDKNINLFNLVLSSTFLKNKTDNSTVSALVEKSDANVLIGTDGGGLYEFNRKTEQVQPVKIPLTHQRSAPLAILALHLNKKNKLYVGTYYNGLIIIDYATGRSQQFIQGPSMKNLTNSNIFCIKEDSKGQIWLGTNGGGVNVLNNDKVVAKFTPKPQYPGEVLLPLNGYIRAIQEDTEGNIWIGSHGGGIAVFQPASNKWIKYNQENSRLPSNKIHALYVDRKGNIWIGTFGGGLALFDRKTKQFVSFTENEGLPNTTIYQIVEDLQGILWFSTNTGISSFDFNTKRFRNFTSNNGIQHSNFVHGSGVVLKDGELFFGGLEGFNYFNPNRLTVNHNVPAVILTDLKISNKPVVANGNGPIAEHISVAKEIRLDYKQNFSLSFVALNYTIPKQNHYAYKLDGFDKDWNYTGTLKTAYYTNLDPGEYLFRVKASNNDAVWSSKDTTIKIYVKPPLWRTTYAYLMYIVVLGGLLFYSRYRSIARIRKKFALQQERQEVKRIQELDRLKLKFLTNLSHDFRTPISLIMGPVSQLIESDGTAGKMDKLYMIRRNAKRLLNLVNQLLDFRKMEEHELKLHLSQGELISFIKEITDSFMDLSERKHIIFTFKSAIDRLNCLFDHDKMERILFNLLSNAFKFTLEEGNISVEIGRIAVADPENTWIKLQVTDTGIGIPADKVNMIFDRFFQNSTGPSILNQGSGIGLSITREFVKMHGGNIFVTSEPEKGSVFTIHLPLKQVAETGIEEQAILPRENNNTAEESALLPTTTPVNTTEEGIPQLRPVLLIEDNEDFRFYLKDNLKNNYKIIEAANGKEGWQKSLSHHPQLIVSDISMPQMNGIELIKKLKSDKRTAHIPVILLTAMAGQEELLNGLKTGANDYITKPFNFEVLNVKIKNLLDLNSTMKSTYIKQIRMSAPDVKITSSDEIFLNKIVSYIEDGLTNPQLSVESLSKQVGVSRGTLYTKLLQITGQTPVEYIRSIRLEKAATLLEKSNMTVAEIAYQVGFTSPNYFAKSFKSRYNMVPSEYIAKMRKEKG